MFSAYNINYRFNMIFYLGRDASKAFITGDFTEQGLTDDVSNLTLNELGDLKEWALKYEKDYVFKGNLEKKKRLEFIIKNHKHF